MEIIVLPAGKSLDVCAALREAERVRKMDATEEVGGRKRRRRRKKKKGNGTSKENGGQDKKPPTNMFDFLNTKIFQRGVCVYMCVSFLCVSNSAQTRRWVWPHLTLLPHQLVPLPALM